MRRSRKVRTAADLEINAPDYPELMWQAGTLDERNGAPAKDQETIREWEDAGAGWKEARAEVVKFVELVGRIDGERKEHEAGCVESRQAPSGSLPSSAREPNGFTVWRSASKAGWTWGKGTPISVLRARTRILSTRRSEKSTTGSPYRRGSRGNPFPWTTTEFRCRQGNFGVFTDYPDRDQARAALYEYIDSSFPQSLSPTVIVGAGPCARPRKPTTRPSFRHSRPTPVIPAEAGIHNTIINRTRNGIPRGSPGQAQGLVPTP